MSTQNNSQPSSDNRAAVRAAIEHLYNALNIQPRRAIAAKYGVKVAALNGAIHQVRFGNPAH